MEKPFLLHFNANSFYKICSDSWQSRLLRFDPHTVMYKALHAATVSR